MWKAVCLGYKGLAWLTRIINDMDSTGNCIFAHKQPGQSDVSLSVDQLACPSVQHFGFMILNRLLIP